MDKKSIIFTSRPLFNKKTKNYHENISDTIKNGVRFNGAPVKITCTTRIANQVVFVYIEVVADATLDAAAIVRKKLNTLFQNTYLFPADIPS